MEAMGGLQCSWLAQHRHGSQYSQCSRENVSTEVPGWVRSCGKQQRRWGISALTGLGAGRDAWGVKRGGAARGCVQGGGGRTDVGAGRSGAEACACKHFFHCDEHSRLPSSPSLLDSSPWHALSPRQALLKPGLSLLGSGGVPHPACACTKGSGSPREHELVGESWTLF